MAALDFPSSPTNGQIYGNFIYSTAKGAWQAKPITGKVTTSATAPSAPSNGDEWFNTNDGNLYVYYTDVDGSQWVQVKSDATLSSTLGTRVEALETTKIGLVPIQATNVAIASGTGSVNSLGVVSFTNATQVRLDGVFTTEYKNYKLLISYDTSTTSEIYLRTSTAGVQESGNVYNYQGVIAYSTNSPAAHSVSSSISRLTLGTSQLVPGAGNVDATVFNPMISTRTGFIWQSSGWNGAYWSINAAGWDTTSNTDDGILFGTVTGTVTGTIQVLGYND